MIRILLLAFTALLPLVLQASHNRLSLKNGTTIYGAFVSGDSKSITFQDERGVRRRFDVQEVQSITFDEQGSYRDDRTGVRRERGEAYRTSDSRIVPAGAEISVRTNERIDSDTATEGRTYSAVIERDVLDNSGAMAIPRGSDAQLAIRDMTSGGAAGSRHLVLDIQSVTVGGQRYLVSTADLERSSRSGIGANRRTAEMVGGGAALGTLLGAIAGGGKGAAIGAIAGAAAGGAVQVLTRGKEVKVPAETVLNFRLDQPVRLEMVR